VTAERMAAGTAAEPLVADVVVCGAGAAGLATARALDSIGLDVLVLEKTPRQPLVWKGEVFQPGALGTLESWGVLHRLEERRALRLNRLVVRTADGAELLPMDYSTLDGDRPWMLAHDHLTILDCLQASLSPSVRVLRGVRVEDAVRDAHGRITGLRAVRGDQQLDVRARLVVAADGMSSRLRKLCGIEESPQPYGHRLLSFELAGAPAVADEVTAYVTERGAVMLYPLPEDRIRIYAQVAADEVRAADPERMRRWGAQLVEQVPALQPLAEALLADLDRRQLLPVWQYRSPTLVRPGIVLAGEAAHIVHPIAAWGMNTSVADAAALAARIASVNLADHAALDQALLDYERERTGPIGDIHTMSHNITRMTTGTTPAKRRLGRRVLRGTARSPRLRYLVTYNMSGLGWRELGPLDRLAQIGVLPDFKARTFRAPQPVSPTPAPQSAPAPVSAPHEDGQREDADR
jgi:2-polyprenyl-6-methoxyphenol hydroxylase-like FAD-dependent oxidoreductase